MSNPSALIRRTRCVMRTVLCSAIVATVSGASLQAGDWSQFRGPNGTGVAEKLSVADTFSLEDAVWKIEAGEGTSSPVIRGERMFTTAFDGTKRMVQCWDMKTGKSIWSRTVESLRKEAFTPPNNAATCSPVVDDKVVCAWFPDAGLFVYDLSGKELWYKDLGPFHSMHGISASPLLVGGKLIITVDQLQDPYIVAFEAATGKELWKTDRLLGVTGGYSTPALVELGNRKVIVSAAPGEMVGYDLESGEKLFSLLGLTNAPVSMPVVSGGRIYYCEPPGKPLPMSALGNADKNQDGVIELEEVKNSVGATRLIERIDKGFGNTDGKVDQAEWDKGFGTFLNKGGLSCCELSVKEGKPEASLKWMVTRSTPYIPSVLVLDGKVFAINDGGILVSLSAETGEQISRVRLGNASGQYYASPVAAGDRMVLANLEGKVSLIRTADLKVLSTLDMEEQITATPCIVDGRLVIRTQRNIYCFGKS